MTKSLICCSWRTKAKGEDAIREYHPTATVIRPSLLFGPGDSFFSASLFFFFWVVIKEATAYFTNKALCNFGKVPPGASSLWRRDHSVPVSQELKNVFVLTNLDRYM